MINKAQDQDELKNTEQQDNKYKQPIFRKILRIFLWLVVIAWMTVIFCFSAQTSEQSSNLSGKTIEVIVTKLVPSLAQHPTEQERVVQSLQGLVRKGAHFSIFAVLGVFVRIALQQYPSLSGRQKFLFSLLICILYAFSDELHQYFVDGRAAQITDVGIDSAGSLLGIEIARLFSLIKIKKINA